MAGEAVSGRPYLWVKNITTLPSVACGCRRFAHDTFGDRVSTCESHKGVLKSSRLGSRSNCAHPPLRGPCVKCQYKVVPSEGKKRGDLEIVGYLRDGAGPRNLVIDLDITHDHHGRSTSSPHRV